MERSGIAPKKIPMTLGVGHSSQDIRCNALRLLHPAIHCAVRAVRFIAPYARLLQIELDWELLNPERCNVPGLQVELL